jgi:hypothetical protein
MLRFPSFALAALALSACALSASGPGDPTASAQQAIVGGTPDTQDGAVVLILVTTGQTSYTCTGALIAPNLVLSDRVCAATLPNNVVDCASSTYGATLDPSTLTVIGDAAPSQSGGGPQSKAAVSQILVPGDAHVCGADVALLVLAAPLPGAITPLVPRLDSAPADGEAFTLVGYGVSSATDPTGSTGGTRRSGSGTVSCTDATCGGADLVPSNEFEVTAGFCEGDSGDPAIAADGRVIGVGSRGGSTCTEGIFERADAWASFLRQGAQTAATAGGYAPPSWAVAGGDAGNEGGGGTPSGGSSSGGSSSGGSSSPGGGCAVAPASSGGCGLECAAATLALGLVLARRRRVPAAA